METDKDAFLSALFAYVDEDYSVCTSQLLNLIPSAPPSILADVHDKLSAVYILRRDYISALQHSELALKSNSQKPEFHVRKGIAHFHLSQYVNALASFQAGLNIYKTLAKSQTGDAPYVMSSKLLEIAKTWSRKCEAEIEEAESSEDEYLNKENDDDELRENAAAAEVKSGSEVKHTDALKEAEKQFESRQKAFKGIVGDESSGDFLPTRNLNSGPLADTFKHEFYQSANHVVLTIKARHCNEENVHINFSNKYLQIQVYNDSHEELIYDRTFVLFGQINVSESNFKVMQTKIEVKLKKALEGNQWMDLERQLDAGEGEAIKSAYSSKKDWRNVEKEIEAVEQFEKPEGDEAMNKLFKEIYGNATEETRRAMNKSFQESGGTVLSTNWDEVAKADYKKDRTAPDGMEWRSWEGDKIPMKEKEYGRRNRN